MNQAAGLLWEVVRGQEGGRAVPQFLGWVQGVTRRARIVLPGFVGLGHVGTRAEKRPETAGTGNCEVPLTRPHSRARDGLGCTPFPHPRRLCREPAPCPPSGNSTRGCSRLGFAPGPVTACGEEAAAGRAVSPELRFRGQRGRGVRSRAAPRGPAASREAAAGVAGRAGRAHGGGGGRALKVPAGTGSFPRHPGVLMAPTVPLAVLALVALVAPGLGVAPGCDYPAHRWCSSRDAAVACQVRAAAAAGAGGTGRVSRPAGTPPACPAAGTGDAGTGLGQRLATMHGASASCEHR